MKKVLVAFFLAIIMILVPVSANAVTVDIKNHPVFNAYNEDAPELFITSDSHSDLERYIDNNYANEPQADAILNSIFSYDSENDFFLADEDILIDSVEEYGYYHVIPDNDLNNVQSKSELNGLIYQYWDFSDYPFGDLINEILEKVKLRLGWIYELYYKGGGLVNNGVTIARQFIDNIQSLEIAIVVAALVNVLITIPIYYFSQSIKALFNLDLGGFSATIAEFTGIFTEDLQTLIANIIAIFELLPEIFQPIIDFANEIQVFVDWIRSEPWKAPITITGNVLSLLFLAYPDAEVSSRGESDITDANGNFEFTVYPTGDSEDSLPANSWYGLHLCQITISKDGEVIKTTPKVLSYVFSGGTIDYTIIVPKSKSLDRGNNLLFNEWVNNLLLRLSILFPNLFVKLRKA